MEREKTALLVIDLQNSFVEMDSPNEIEPIKENIGKVKTFIDFCRGKGIQVIYTRHSPDRINSPIESRLFSSKFIDALKKGTRGWEICERIKPDENETVIDKYKYDAFFGTNLNDIFKSKGTQNVIIIGTITQVCCESTARTAMFHNYNVIFCSDLTFSFDEKLHENTLKVMKRNFGDVLTSDEIMQMFS